MAAKEDESAAIGSGCLASVFILATIGYGVDVGLQFFGAGLIIMLLFLIVANLADM